MFGKMQAMENNLNDVEQSSEKGNFSGIGMAMEYFGNNPVIQEFMMSMVWGKKLPQLETWISDYVKDRYGSANEDALKAWDDLLKTVYNTNKQTGTFLCERPDFYNPKLAYRTSPIPDYDMNVLSDALQSLLNCSAAFKDLDTYQFDVVNLTRQFISPLGYYWILELQDAYEKKDLTKFLQVKEQFIGLIKDFDVLLSTKREYLLGNWIDDAKKWGDTKQEKELYEWNARNIITLWGGQCTEGQYDDLNNYAYKQWAGMFTDYHLVRWNKFFDEVETAMRKNEKWNRAPFLESSCAWEKNWSKSHNIFPAKPHGDPVEVSRRIYMKYRDFVLNKGK